MSIRRILGHALVASYLAIVAFGAAQAVRRTERVPFGRVTGFMYGMLAPYQGYSETTEGYAAEGWRDGAWEPIDLAPYYPVLPGERSMREQYFHENLASFPSDDGAQRAYAEKLLSLERAGGRPYDSLRLSWTQWRPEPDGFRAGAEGPIRSVVLVTVP